MKKAVLVVSIVLLNTACGSTPKVSEVTSIDKELVMKMVDKMGRVEIVQTNTNNQNVKIESNQPLPPVAAHQGYGKVVYGQQTYGPGERNPLWPAEYDTSTGLSVDAWLKWKAASQGQ